MNCVNCNTELSGKQKKYCSSRCKHSTTNNKHQNYVAQQARGQARKLELIKQAGGSCVRCGYRKCLAALCFHHKETKNFALDVRNLSNRTWHSLVEEAKTCELLCQNCHMEVHHGLL